MRTNLPLLRWLVAHPVVRAGDRYDAFLDEHPPLSAPPRPLPGRAFAGGWRLNLAPPVPAPAPSVDGGAHAAHVEGGDGVLRAPMPGTVIAVHVAAGDRVEARQPLVVVEAMKMEHALLAPFDGVVVSVTAAVGDPSARSAILVELGDEEAGA